MAVMKKRLLLILLFISSLLHAQKSSDVYKELWEEVKAKELELLPKSSLVKVNDIYKKALRENNEEQKIKCLLYKSKYSLVLEENAKLKIIHNFQNQIAHTENKVSKAIVHSLLAHLYWDYLKQHRWKIYHRTHTDKVLNSDFRTWDLKRLHHEIHFHFKASLKEEHLLKKTNLDAYKALVVEQDREIEITVFEFLAHKALDFYKNDEGGILNSKESFVIDREEYLTELESVDLETEDKESIKYLSLKIYQELIRFYKNTKNQEAYFKTLLQTADYIEHHSNFLNFKKLKLAYLQDLQKRHHPSKARVFIDFEIAKLYYELGETYVAGKTKTHQFKLKKALEVSEGLLQKYSEHQLSGALKALLKVIKSKELTCEIEAYVPIDQNLKALISYRNSDFFYGTIYKLNQRQYEELKKEKTESKRVLLLKKIPVFKEWQARLPVEGDYQKHTTEILLPKIPQGTYVLAGGYTKENHIATHQYFQVTNLTFLKTGSTTFQVLDRQNGFAYSNVDIHLESKPINKRSRKIDKSFTTDEKGTFEFKTENYYRNVKATVTSEVDTAYFENIYISSQRNYSPKTQTIYKPFVFTDRSIYRPGQQVFFKAIVLQKNGEKTKLISKTPVEVALYDVNNQEVQKTTLELNEFGTVASAFQLPLGGLNGVYRFKIYKEGKSIGSVNTNISVEEYKRPTFKTNFNPVEGVFKINDSVVARGNAIALSGSKVTHAKVRYKVVRKTRFPRWCWWAVPSNEVEITQGETTTDANGAYSVKFKALPDVDLDANNHPVFYYVINAYVTDIHGETRSAKTQVKVGYHALTINMSVKDRMNHSEKNIITIVSKNLNDQTVFTKGTIKIYKLTAPEKVYRKRPWSSPDLQTFSKEEYQKLFPFELYESTSLNVNNWEKGTAIFSEQFDTKKETVVRLKKTKKWASGKYIAIATAKDKWGQLIKDEQIFTLVNSSAERIVDHQMFDISIDKEIYEPNEFVTLSVGASVDNMTVFVAVEKNHKTVSTHQIRLDNQIKKIKFPVYEDDRGGFAVKWHRVNYNAIDSGVLHISVPYESKKLSIETLTFRDLLEPGASQKWSFKIKGVHKEKATAEMLASMYDVSLDQFKPHDWKFNPIQLPIYRTSNNLRAYGGFKTKKIRLKDYTYRHFYEPTNLVTAQFNWFGLSFRKWQRSLMMSKRSSTNTVLESITTKDIGVFDSESQEIEEDEDALSVSDAKKIKEKLENIKVRTHFNETAFFFPQLKTDKNGDVAFEFTMPEDLTTWKLQLLAHDKELNSTTETLTAVTQKKLMVQPNIPRFLREGDAITLSTKISNLTDAILQGKARLELTDAVTGKNIDELLYNNQANQDFSVVKKGNTVVSWRLQIPENIKAVQYKIIAATSNFSDGEQNVIPVLSNRMLVTETLPLWVNGGETKTYTLEKLKNNTSKSLQHHQLTLEMTSNPAWYAVQALPYLMEYPHECSEQTFARYYANQLASHIVNSNPKIKEVFNQWASSDALVSNLEKNQELKSIIIQETPWLRDAQSETEQKKRIALLFNLSKMKDNLEQSVNKLSKMQFSNGAFPWFAGSDYPNRNITQHIVQGFLHLQHLGVNIENSKIKKIIEKAQVYLDSELMKGYEQLLLQAEKIKRQAKTEKEGVVLAAKYMEKKHLYSFQLQYLYVRSFKSQTSTNKELERVIEYYLNQSVQYWKQENLYNKGLIALIQYRNKNHSLANDILKSLKENNITSDEMGMYWKENTASWNWYQAPIETQSLMIEVFSEVGNDFSRVDHLKKWLLKNKQTQQWKTTKATSEAVYALLLQGTDWLSIDEAVEVTIGKEKLDANTLQNVKVEAGTGYFKTSWKGHEITKERAEVTLVKKNKGIAWGGLYWQYFEDLDKIDLATSPLKINKKVFKKTNTANGPLLSEVDNTSVLKVGDLLTIRIELSTDRAMEFIHMKDMRASGLEPVDVLSGYRRQDGLGYYQSTKDASTHFFFDKIRKGIYVFEYDVRVSHHGNFSNGITTIQSMYAPEFGSHSKGIRIEVK